jgi:hypothetical protein
LMHARQQSSIHARTIHQHHLTETALDGAAFITPHLPTESSTKSPLNTVGPTPRPHLAPRLCVAQIHSHHAPRCRSPHSAGHISSATMLSRQLARLMSTSSASSSGCCPLVALAHRLPGWPCC